MLAMPSTAPSGFDDLPVEGQIAYVEALRDRIADHATDVPVPDRHLEVIRERSAGLDAAPGDADVRRALIRRFPYGIYSVESSTTVFVLAVLYLRRRPGAWRRR